MLSETLSIQNILGQPSLSPTQYQAQPPVQFPEYPSVQYPGPPPYQGQQYPAQQPPMQSPGQPQNPAQFQNLKSEYDPPPPYYGAI